MKHLRNIGLVLIITTLLSGCKTANLNNIWVEKPINIDGQFDDWDNSQLTYFKDQNVMMGSANDGDNLYVMIRTTDIRMVRRVGMMGLTVWVNGQGKKDKTYGIQFAGNQPPIAGPEATDDRRRPAQARKMQERMRVNLPAPGHIVVIQDEDKNEMPADNLTGPAAASKDNKGVFCYEYRIPLPLNTKADKDIKLCLELGGMDDDMRDEMRSQMGRQRGGGMTGGGMRGGGMSGGGMRGGGRGMGGPGGRMGGRQRPDISDLEKQDIWVKVKLQNNPGEQLPRNQ